MGLTITSFIKMIQIHNTNSETEGKLLLLKIFVQFEEVIPTNAQVIKCTVTYSIAH